MTIEPDVEGEYVIQAACDNITDTFRFIAGTVTLSEYGFTGNAKTTLISDDGTYGDESGDPVPVPEYQPGQDPSPVCYVRDASVTVEATFTITPDLGADEFDFPVGGDATLMTQGTKFKFDDTIVLTGSSVTHEFTLSPILPDVVLNDTLQLAWAVCELVVVNHAMYITYGTPSDGVATVTRMSRVTSACNNLDEESDIVEALWEKVAGPAAYTLGAPMPSPIWKILDGIPGECIAIANLFVATMEMLGVTPGDGQVTYCYVDRGGMSHESNVQTDFTTRGCNAGQNGHDAQHGPTHANFNQQEKLVWVDSNNGINNWEACYKYRADASQPYLWYAAGTGGDPPWPSVQAVMSAYARWTLWQYVDANWNPRGNCQDPGPYPEQNPY
ncbi:MAG: hypothetical protein ACREHD_32540 [Pirellulales bacterium]